MAAKSNQEIEHHYFELFRRIYPLPDGEVTYEDKPDIMIGERRLGIEVTIFYLEEGNDSESEQKQRNIRKVVLKRAHQKYIDKGGKNEINFSFNKNHPIRDIRKLVSKIVDVIFRLEVIETGEIRISNYFSDIPELDFIYIKPNIYNNHQWIYQQSHVGFKIMSIDKLKQILRDKEKKAENYNKCDAYWLLVVIDSFDRAQEQVIPEEILNGEVKLASDIYEKIIVFQTPQDNFMEFSS